MAGVVPSCSTLTMRSASKSTCRDFVATQQLSISDRIPRSLVVRRDRCRGTYSRTCLVRKSSIVHRNSIPIFIYCLEQHTPTYTAKPLEVSANRLLVFALFRRSLPQMLSQWLSGVGSISRSTRRFHFVRGKSTTS